MGMDLYDNVLTYQGKALVRDETKRVCIIKFTKFFNETNYKYS